jgi:hypothetical protein
MHHLGEYTTEATKQLQAGTQRMLYQNVHRSLISKLNINP